MDAWIKVLVVLILMSAMSMVLGVLLFDPFSGLILVAVILTLMVLTVEPATGKAMATVTIPIVIILFVIEVALFGASLIFEPWMLFVIGAILYMLFAMFTGGGGILEGGFIDAKLSLKLFPIYGVAIFISYWIDPTGHTTVYVMVGSIGCLMALYVVFLRGYDHWPQYEYGKMYNIVAMSDINPKGKVRSGQELWWAKTSGPPIAAGERVRVLGISGMTMIVAKEDSTGSAFEQS
ncbi:MAG: NfeD family protein [Candidatus Thorarchaeota archaeon]|nr:NfeD family protein [Candidatus Thorarchaeota archaeon]